MKKLTIIQLNSNVFTTIQGIPVTFGKQLNPLKNC